MTAAVSERLGEKEVRDTFSGIQRYLRDITGLDTTKSEITIAPLTETRRVGTVPRLQTDWKRSRERMTLAEAVSSTLEIFDIAAGLRHLTADAAFAKAAASIEQQDTVEKMYFDMLSYVNDQLFGVLCAYEQVEHAIPSGSFAQFAALLLKTEARKHIAALDREVGGFSNTFDMDAETKDAEREIRKNIDARDGLNALFDENLINYLVKANTRSPTYMSVEGVKNYWLLVGDTLSIALLSYKSNVELFLEMSATSLEAMEIGDMPVFRVVPDAYADDDDAED